MEKKSKSVKNNPKIQIFKLYQGKLLDLLDMKINATAFLHTVFEDPLDGFSLIAAKQNTTEFN